MALAQYRQVLKSDSVAVVGDLDELEAAVLNEEVDGGGGGVEAVLDELLDGGDGALDDLAGGDAVDHGVAEAVDFGRVDSGQGFDLGLNQFHFHAVGLNVHSQHLLPLAYS